MTQPVDLAPLSADALASDPRLGAELAPATHPLALLPVRLETRYAGGELLVRIYPDQLHVDAHDPRLSAAEAEAGRTFWRDQWRTGSDRPRQQRRWDALAERLGPGRAAWVVRATRPGNPGDRPAAAVPDGAALVREPAFGAIQVTQERDTPRARLLPERWTVTAYAGGTALAVVTGAPVSAELPVGPDLSAPLVGADDDDEVAAVDQGMHWLVDFAAAEQRGMAVRLPISSPVDLLLVTGVRSGDPATSARELEALLTAQRYSAGLGFVPPDTPTNNATAARSGWSSGESGGWSVDDRTAAPGTVAALIRAALGVDDQELFGSLANSDRTDATLAEAMTTALWPATWGYWLTQFAGVDAETVDWAREHARRFVRPEGPLPTLRVGRQPYGLLPVTSLNRFAGGERLDRLRRVLDGLREVAWRPAAGSAPRLGRGEVAADLVDVLRLEGRSDDLRLRRGAGPRFADNAFRFLGHDLDAAGFWTAARDRSLEVTAAAGVGPLPGALTVHEPGNRPVTLPLVADHGAVVRALLSADPDALAASPGNPGSVLEVLLRHSLLREHADRGARLLGRSSADPELLGFGDDAVAWTALRDSALPGGGTVRQRLSGTGPDEPLGAFRVALATLAEASAGDVERHLLATLDAGSHRLDAWVTSLATARLADLRGSTPAGVLVGGYGWVERLQPGPATAVQPLPDEPGPLLAAADDPGFVHAPSVHQAQVAAMLRNAHLSHGGGEHDPFAVSLTSERVRLARWLFDQVRAGRTVGAALGYLVERDLHERGMDFAVDDAREVAPLPGQEELPLAARRLDGLRLHQLWADSEGHAVDHLLMDAPDDSLRPKAIAVLRRLNAAVDAAADALQAEQVHQFARGDLSRAVSSVADLDRGLAPPPDLDFVQTPRSGASITHRVAILIDPDARAADGWAADTPLAAADPGLDAWLGRLLGPATGRQLTLLVDGVPVQVALTELNLAAADFVRLASSEGGLRELAGRAALASGASVETAVVQPDRDLLALLELGRSLAALVTAATPLDGAALQPPHTDPLPGVDMPELTARLGAVRERVDAAVRALDAALGSADPDALRTAVLGSWPLGVGEAGVPTARTGWPAAAARARQDLANRVAAASGASGGPGVPALLAELRTLLGPGAVVLPRFAAAGAGELAASRDDPDLTGDDPLAAEVWLTRMERVREPLARAGIALRAAEAMGGTPLELSAAQSPHRRGDRWNALPASGYVDGAVSLLLVGGELLGDGRVLSGLLVDEWSEVVPSATQTTGVAFRYDPPESMAPHAVLLAVPPAPGEPWTAGRLNQVLVETLELAHLRAVPPAALGAVRQFLPASVLAFNAAGEVPSSDPNALTPPARG